MYRLVAKGRRGDGKKFIITMTVSDWVVTDAAFMTTIKQMLIDDLKKISPCMVPYSLRMVEVQEHRWQDEDGEFHYDETYWGSEEIEL